MLKFHILVEGDTEYYFVKRILQNYFDYSKYQLIPSILTTKKTPTKKFTGGYSKYSRIRSDILSRLRDSSANIVTTMIDYYGLSDDFPGKLGVNSTSNIYSTISQLESAFLTDIDSDRFIPYLQVHEFEALLFSDTDEIVENFAVNIKRSALISYFRKINSSFNNPEEINNHPQTCPSQRLKTINPGYSKPNDGTRIAEQIGIENMKTKCKHFRDWIDKLSTLSSDL